MARATQAELEELGRLFEAAKATGKPTPEKDALLFKCWERILEREAPTLAGDFRARRCLLCRELTRLESEWRAQGCHHSTSERDRAFYNLATAKANRWAEIVHRGGEALEDPEEAARRIERIIDPTTSLEKILSLIRWP